MTARRSSTTFALTTALLAASVAGCGASSGSTAPQTDDEKISALYAKFYDALQNKDDAKFLQLVCPLVRPDIKPSDWYRDAARIPKPATTVSESYIPTTATTAAPGASQWRRITSVGGEKLQIRIAKLDADWYVCET
ncbi:hypothetical protein [Tsukamurella sp. NPDC003166]|uniref:hypothetical protein n=1 Tax=Tsukamurella sp. NPDC003166 TaxID=3154444 RepID=UPI0033ACC15E